MLWGYSEYKSRFGAINHKLYNISVYRFHFLLTIEKIATRFKSLVLFAINIFKKIIKRFFKFPIQ